ncbi:MAG: Uma2 family endonuclease, partial [Oscillospiraceae bacterium]|nr:Uma2 family endonuclease [Oscillospiraceae bacterium]
MSLADRMQPEELSLEEFQRFAETHDGFWELEEGVPVKMEPASDEHQWISLEISSAFREYFKGKTCRPRQELDVWTGKIPFNETARKMKAAVRKPDILVYCDKEQKRNGIILSPQLVVEIWSPTNTMKERNKKLGEYFRIGVQEFW